MNKDVESLIRRMHSGKPEGKRLSAAVCIEAIKKKYGDKFAGVDWEKALVEGQTLLDQLDDPSQKRNDKFISSSSSSDEGDESEEEDNSSSSGDEGSDPTMEGDEEGEDDDDAPSSKRLKKDTTPRRDPNTKEIVFPDVKAFRPNLTPEEVLRGGAFGGGYFRDIHSSVTGKSYTSPWKELPAAWLTGLNIPQMVARRTYAPSINKFRVNCGYKEGSDDAFGLEAWEKSGWIMAQDPYGWFQWYCRFYEGRRSPDDKRQIQRWCACAGPTGRWRNNLIGKVLQKANNTVPYADPKISPVVRQTLWHWGYQLTERDVASSLEARAKRTKA